jgi:hypothetical protein
VFDREVGQTFLTIVKKQSDAVLVTFVCFDIALCLNFDYVFGLQTELLCAYVCM